MMHKATRSWTTTGTVSITTVTVLCLAAVISAQQQQPHHDFQFDSSGGIDEDLQVTKFI